MSNSRLNTSFYEQFLLELVSFLIFGGRMFQSFRGERVRIRVNPSVYWYKVGVIAPGPCGKLFFYADSFMEVSVHEG